MMDNSRVLCTTIVADSVILQPTRLSSNGVITGGANNLDVRMLPPASIAREVLVERTPVLSDDGTITWGGSSSQHNRAYQATEPCVNLPLADGTRCNFIISKLTCDGKIYHNVFTNSEETNDKQREPRCRHAFFTSSTAITILKNFMCETESQTDSSNPSEVVHTWKQSTLFERIASSEISSQYNDLAVWMWLRLRARKDIEELPIYLQDSAAVVVTGKYVRKVLRGWRIMLDWTLNNAKQNKNMPLEAPSMTHMSVEKNTGIEILRGRTENLI